MQEILHWEPEKKTSKTPARATAYEKNARLSAHLILVDLAAGFLRQEPVGQQSVSPESRHVGADDRMHLYIGVCTTVEV